MPGVRLFSRSTEPRLLEEYVVPGKVRLVYRDMAFLGQESIDAAVGARAAQQLLGGDGFWRFHDLLFHNQDGENEGAFDRSVLADMAVSLGIDRGAFLAALDDPGLIDAVEAETQAGARAGVSSTPTLDINGMQAAGAPAYDVLAEYLDGLLAGAMPERAGEARVDGSGDDRPVGARHRRRGLSHVGQADRDDPRVRGPVGVRDGREQPVLRVPGHPRRRVRVGSGPERCWPARSCGGGAPTGAA